MKVELERGGGTPQLAAFVGKGVQEAEAVRHQQPQDGKLVRLLELAGVLDVATSAWLSPICALGTLVKPVAHVGDFDAGEIARTIAASNAIPGLFSDKPGLFPAPGLDDHLVCPIGNRYVGRAALFVRPRSWHASVQSRLTDTINRIRQLVDTVWVMLRETQADPAAALILPVHDDVRAETLANQCPFGVLVLGVDQVVHFANRPAQGLLKGADVMSLVQNRLIIGQSGDAVRFQVALHAVLAQPAGSRKSIAIAGADGLPLLVSISRMADAGHESRACVIITRPSAAAEPDVCPLAEHFSLTPVEVRLVSQLMKGLSVQEAATALQLKVQTVRTYLKQIFQKTGTHRQVELMQLMQNGALPIL